MKIFIKGEYVDLEKFNHFSYNKTCGEMVLSAVNRAGDSSVHWASIEIKMTKEEYDSLLLSISNFFQIPILL